MVLYFHFFFSVKGVKEKSRMQRDRSPLGSSFGSPVHQQSTVSQNEIRMQRDRSPLSSPLGSPVRQPLAVSRQLYSSPRSSDFDLIGYVSVIGVLRTSEAGNSYANIMFKTGAEEKDKLVIKVMYADQHPLLRMKHQPVQLMKLSKGKNNYNNNVTTFFNTKAGASFQTITHELSFESGLNYTSLDSLTRDMGTINVQGNIFWLSADIMTTPNRKQFRNAIITDGVTEMRLTVWNNQTINDIKDEDWYELTDVNVRWFHGIKLETSPITIVSKMEGMTKVKKPDVESYNEKEAASSAGIVEHLENPKITSATAVIEYKCIFCKNIVEKIPNAQFIKCQASECQRRFFAEECPKVVHGMLDITSSGRNLNLTWEIQNISAVVDSTSDADVIEMNLLLLSKKDFRLHYIPKSNSVVKIEVNAPSIDPHSGQLDILDNKENNQSGGGSTQSSA